MLVVFNTLFYKKSGTDLHFIVFICALFGLSVFYCTDGVRPGPVLGVVMAVGLGLFE